jgi:type II secretory pathway component PulC
VSFDGLIVKNATPLALLNVSGDFFTVREGETILGKIRVLKITREMVTIEYDGQPYEIRTKGD